MTARPEERTTQQGETAGARPEDAPVLDAYGQEFTEKSLAELVKSGIPPERAAEFGIRAVRRPEHALEAGIDRYWLVCDGVENTNPRYPGMLFEWRDLARVVHQFRPDEAVLDGKGDAHKYVLPADCGAFLSHWRAGEPGQPVLFVEGTKQGISAACWAPEGWGIVVTPGCQNWVTADLSWVEGCDVVVLFDADLEANRDVYDAAVKFKEAAEAFGAGVVSFAKLAAARAKEGLDDVLGRMPADKRTDYLRRICEKGVRKLGRRPAKRSENPYIGDKGLLARTAALAVLEGQPAALASGSQVALYRHGVYIVERGNEPLVDKISALLGEDYRTTHRATIEEFLVGELVRRGRRLPERMDRPVLNCANGLLDLVTGEFRDHDPAWLSAQQIPVAWDPNAQCPNYLAWMRQVIPEQLEALEEVASTMLDPSRTPGKTAFLFGPSRSGKSTFLRLLQAMAGQDNYSAVTLHQLADNKFMAAPIYLKMLNVGSDLSSDHVRDLSLFKMLSGEDPVEADRKYGRPFRFTNQALFAFSANDLPTVGENSDAYTNRIAPFQFPYSFAGREDPRVEDAVLAELPGILVRWVKAWQAFNVRGAYLPPNAAVSQEFETRSDRVARWFATRCDVFPDAVNTTVGQDQGMTVQSLYEAFKAWVLADGGAAPMSRPKFAERLRGLRGVGDVILRHHNRNKGLNVVTHQREDAQIGRIIPKASEQCVDSVGCVGGETSSPYVCETEEMIKEDRGSEVRVSESYGKDAQLPTQPTLPTQATSSPGDPLDDAASWLMGGLNPVTPGDAPRGSTEALEFLGAWVTPTTPPAVNGHAAAMENPFAESDADPENPFAGPSDDLENPFADVDAAPAGNPFGNPTDTTPPWEV